MGNSFTAVVCHHGAILWSKLSAYRDNSLCQRGLRGKLISPQVAASRLPSSALLPRGPDAICGGEAAAALPMVRGMRNSDFAYSWVLEQEHWPRFIAARCSCRLPFVVCVGSKRYSLINGGGCFPRGIAFKALNLRLQDRLGPRPQRQRPAHRPAGYQRVELASNRAQTVRIVNGVCCCFSHCRLHAVLRCKTRVLPSSLALTYWYLLQLLLPGMVTLHSSGCYPFNDTTSILHLVYLDSYQNTP